MYFILFIAIAVASYAVQASLKSKFSTYSNYLLHFHFSWASRLICAYGIAGKRQISPN